MLEPHDLTINILKKILSFNRICLNTKLIEFQHDMKESAKFWNVGQKVLE